MSTEVQQDTPQRRHTYYTDFIWRKAEAIDEFVAYARMHPEDNWDGSEAAYKHWGAICDTMLDKHSQLELPFPNSHATSVEAINTAEQLLTTGTFQGKRVDTPLLYIRAGGWNHSWPDSGSERGSAREAYRRRIILAHLALYSPAVFDTFQSHEVIAFHGTKGYALPSIIAQGGLQSHYRLAEEDHLVGSGELHLGGIRRMFISFDEFPGDRALCYMNKDIRADNKDYIEERKDEYEGARLRHQEIAAFEKWLAKEKLHNKFIEYADQSRFGVMLGLSRSALLHAGLDDSVGKRVNVIDADADELAFASHVSLKHIPLLLAEDADLEHVQNYLDSIALPEAFKLVSLDGLKRALRYEQHTVHKFHTR